ncbi:glycoside hydrolase family 128 protein [Hypoxylon crocopeplum]|nr:glycoside hydrolase family 128 protein [Hypoxylon crocopeplum]
MYTKLSILALCAAVSVKEVAAASLHRHLHPKREIVWAETDTVVITEYVTMTVTAGEEGFTAQAIPTSSVEVKGKKGGHHHSDYTAPAVSSTVSSASQAIESSTAIVDAASPTTPETEPTYPASTATTLATLVKPTSTPEAKPPVTSSVVESLPVESPPVVAIPASPTTAEAPATTTSTTAPAATSTATTPSSGSGTSKRGAAYNDATLVSTLLTLTNKISWAYNWGSDSGNLQADVAYYPMLWSPASEHSSDWDTKAEAALSKGSDCLLSFNEPDITAQANLSPEVAASKHIQFMNGYAGKARIGSPAISSSENPNQGIDWLNQFFTACNGKCQVDFCASHWYGPGGQEGADLFLTHVKNVHEACENKNVWVTEFAAESGDVDAFMTAITEALDSDEYSYVEKYSYFMLNENSLMSSATSLSSFGKIFAGVA